MWYLIRVILFYWLDLIISLKIALNNYSNAIKAELTAFRDSILLDTPTLVSELDGYMAMDVAHKILNKIKLAAKDSAVFKDS